MSTFYEVKISICQHFRKQKCPSVNILEDYVIGQDILKDLFVDGFVTDESDLTDKMYKNAAMHDEYGAWHQMRLAF